jgi:hypothetical protein
MLYYTAYTIKIPIFPLISFKFFLFQIILDIINFVKIKISNLNTQSETQN